MASPKTLELMRQRFALRVTSSYLPIPVEEEGPLRANRASRRRQLKPLIKKLVRTGVPPEMVRQILKEEEERRIKAGHDPWALK